MLKKMTLLMIMACGLAAFGCSTRYTYNAFEANNSKKHILVDEVKTTGSYYVFGGTTTIVESFYQCTDTPNEMICVKECDNNEELACPYITQGTYYSTNLR